MVRIVADTSTMYSTTQAREAGFEVAPLSVTIAGKTYDINLLADLAPQIDAIFS